MSTLHSRLDRPEQTNSPKVWGRFITVRAGECDDARAGRYLADHGVDLGPHDLLLVETHADPGAGGYVAAHKPISHHIVECNESLEDTLARLEDEP